MGEKHMGKRENIQIRSIKGSDCSAITGLPGTCNHAMSCLNDSAIVFHLFFGLFEHFSYVLGTWPVDSDIGVEDAAAICS